MEHKFGPVAAAALNYCAWPYSHRQIIMAEIQLRYLFSLFLLLQDGTVCHGSKIQTELSSRFLVEDIGINSSNLKVNSWSFKRAYDHRLLQGNMQRRESLGQRGQHASQQQPPSCIYPNMWEKVSAPGRKCCGGCKKCPKWGGSDVLRVIGANHKSGTYLSIGVMQSVREAAIAESCLLAATTVVSVHWAGLDSCRACQPLGNRRTLVMAFVRDPFELIVSGYLYHLAGKESWCTWSMKRGFRGPKDEVTQVDFGITKLLRSSSAPQVSDNGESYQGYLKRLDAYGGILAEFIRASHRDLPALEAGWTAAKASTELRNASYECLDSFMEPKSANRDPFSEAWGRVFRFFGYPEASIPGSIRAAQKHDIIRNPQTLKGHGTQHETPKRRMLYKTAIEVDRKVFHGKYMDLSKRLACPQPSNSRSYHR